MKKYMVLGLSIVIVLAAIIGLIIFIGADYTEAGKTQSLTFMHDGVEREYLLYIPENYTTDMPFLLALHEGNG